jgi:protoporphyrinogen oxidase
MTSIAILGSGMAGLGASYRLAQEGLSAVMYDMKDHCGGHTASYADASGFVFDEGPHISFTKDARIQQLFADNVKGEYQVIHANVNNYWQGRWIKHPAQCNLYGLPPAVVREMLTGLIEAHYTESPPAANYEEWLVASFGRPFAQTFPMQYGRKYHTTDAANMSIDWLGPRLYKPSLDEVLAGALGPSTSDVHYIGEFRYPTRGGFVSYLRPLLDGVDLRLEHRLVNLDPQRRTLRFANGVETGYDRVISSIPLPELIPLIDQAPPGVVAAAERLACSTCVIVNIGIDRQDISDWHWTYFYDDDFCFSRISFPHMLSPNNAPPGSGSIQCELYFSKKYKPLDCAPEACIPRAIADLKRCGLVREDDRVLFTSVLVAKYANVIFDLDRAGALGTVHSYLDEIGVHYCGRYGEWGYQWTDEAFKSGESAAQQALDSRAVAGR